MLRIEKDNSPNIPRTWFCGSPSYWRQMKDYQWTSWQSGYWPPLVGKTHGEDLHCIDEHNTWEYPFPHQYMGMTWQTTCLRFLELQWTCCWWWNRKESLSCLLLCSDSSSKVHGFTVKTGRCICNGQKIQRKWEHFNRKLGNVNNLLTVHAVPKNKCKILAICFLVYYREFSIANDWLLLYTRSDRLFQ